MLKIDVIKLQANGTESIFLPYIAAGPELVLVDSGYPGMAEQIECGLLEKGLRLSDVTQIWLTHHDHDHVGSLAEIKNRHPKINIKANKAEIVPIEGKQISLRLQQAMAQQSSMPEEEQAGGLGFQAYLKTIAPCKVDKALMPGSSMLQEQILVLGTPGHTEGHVSFYAPACQTFIAGDLVVLEDGMLKLPFPQYAFNLTQVKKSIMAVAEFPIRRVICYHGGIVEESAEEIRTMLQAASKSSD